jgi:hypothetical protein
MYVDDSGNPSMTAGAGSYDVLSGIIIHESHLKYIENKVKEYKAKSFVRVHSWIPFFHYCRSLNRLYKMKPFLEIPYLHSKI